MAVAIACPACGKRYKVPEDRCGKKVRCQCGEAFVATAEKSGSSSPLKPIGAPPKGAPQADLPPLASSPAAWDVQPFESTSGPALTPPQMSAAPTFGPQFKIVNDKYFRAAVTMLVMGMIGFAAPDLAKNLRVFRNAKPSEFPIGASIFIALGAGCMFYSQRTNLKVAFMLSGGMLVCVPIGWLLVSMRESANPAANGPQIVVNQPAPPTGRPAPIVPQFMVKHEAESPSGPLPQPRERRDEPQSLLPRIGEPPKNAQTAQARRRQEVRDLERVTTRKFKFDSLRTHANDVAYSEPLGGNGGDEFAAIDNALRPVVGFRYDVREWTGENVLGKLEPLYDRQPPRAGQLVVAKDGYAVGGLVVDAGKFVGAVRVIFLKLDGDHLNASDSYQSEWIGNPSAEEPKTLAGDGQVVVGVYGGHGIILDSVGLILRKR